MKGFKFTILGACASDLRLLRLQVKKNRARRSEMRTSPPTTPPMIGVLSMVAELEEPLVGTLVEVGVFEVVEVGVFGVIEVRVFEVVEVKVFEVVGLGELENEVVDSKVRVFEVVEVGEVAKIEVEDHKIDDAGCTTGNREESIAEVLNSKKTSSGWENRQT